MCISIFSFYITIPVKLFKSFIRYEIQTEVNLLWLNLHVIQLVYYSSFQVLFYSSFFLDSMFHIISTTYFRWLCSLYTSKLSHLMRSRLLRKKFSYNSRLLSSFIVCIHRQNVLVNEYCQAAVFIAVSNLLPLKWLRFHYIIFFTP